MDKWINWLWVAGRIDIMDEYMGGRRGGQVNGSMDRGKADECISRWVGGWMDWSGQQVAA